MTHSPDPPAWFRAAAATRGAAGRTADWGRSALVRRPRRTRAGAAHAAGPAVEPGIVRTVTLPTFPGSRRRVVLAAPEVIETLMDTGRSSVFATGLVPGGVAAALSTVDILHNQPELPGYVVTRAKELASMARELDLEINDPAGAVVPIVLGPPETALRAAAICAEHGVRAGCLRPPSVPAGRSCLRLTARANLSSDDPAVIRGALTAVAKMMKVTT